MGLLIWLGTGSVLRGQCNLQWLSAGGYPGADETVHAAIMWDPDGVGPAPRVAVVGGGFAVVGDALAARIAVYDPTTEHCSALGSGMNGTVRAMLAMPNGDLLAAGSFTVAGGVPVSNIARWDGTGWNPLGSGIGGPVQALALTANGDVIAGGSFATAGGTAAANIARWDGVMWSPLGSGVSGPVFALAMAPNGDVVAAGDMLTAGGVSVGRVARWTTNGWQAVGAGCNGSVLGVLVLPNGDIVAAGSFSQAGGVPAAYVARYDGLAWTPMNAGLLGPFGQSIQVKDNGQLVLGTSGAGRYLVWSGSAWLAYLAGQTAGYPGLPSSVHRVVDLGNGEWLVVGEFRSAAYAQVMARMFRVRNGGSFGPIGLGWVNGGWTDGSVRCLAQVGSGEVVLTGDSPSMPAPGSVDAWDGVKWNGFGFASAQGGFASSASIRALAGLANGRVLAPGNYWIQGYQPPYWILYQHFYSAAVIGPGFTGYSAAWSWSPSYQQGGRSMAAMPNGDFVISVGFTSFPSFPAQLTRYDNNGQMTGSGVITGLADAFESMTVMANGDVVGSGAFASGNILRGSGTTWFPLGAGLGGPAQTLITTANGDVIAGGDFLTAGGAPANRIARWNGAGWLPLGTGLNGPVRALLELPTGDLLVGGAFTMAGGQPAANLARWDGASWSSVAAGTNAPVNALLLARDGTIWVGGAFTVAGTVGCGCVARLVSTCPAAATPFGSGCVGSGGLNTLVATTLPWLGGTFRSRATGMPSNGLALAVNGNQTWTVPLSAILPIGVPGCDLRATPDVLDLYLPSSGSVTVLLTLPSASVLVGQQLYQQVVPIELDAMGSLSALTATNALMLTVGAM